MDWEGRRLLDSMADPVVAVDGEGTVRTCNEAAETLLGPEDPSGMALSTLFSPDERVADRYADTLDHYADVGGVIEDDAAHFERDHPTLAAVLAGRDPTDDDPDVGVFVDGDLRYYYLTAPSLAGTDGRLVVFRDITRVKRHERDLDFLMQVLSRVLRHNLRNDLSVIRGYAEAIAEPGDRRATMAETIADKSHDLVETSEKARLIQKAIEVEEPVTVDLASLVEDCVAEVREEHPEADYAVDVEEGDAPVSVNPKLPSALEDAIENGVIYSESTPPRVEVTARREGSIATLEVADNGPGIPETELRIFEHRGETDLVHGSGAGLWLLYTVVEQSGGEVTFDVDDGTTVRIRLPVAD